MGEGLWTESAQKGTKNGSLKKQTSPIIREIQIKTTTVKIVTPLIGKNQSIYRAFIGGSKPGAHT